MFINFWYVTGRSDELADKPVKRRMLGQDFILFRDSDGKAHCLSNTCTHRGGSLAGGNIKGDCIECPYHGWQFDGDGHCTKIPSLGKDARIPGRARIDAYPTTERHGLVFAFLGDLPEEERPPIMEIPEFTGDTPDEGWRATIQNFAWDFDFKRSIENGIDGAHNEYVHPTHSYSGERDTFVPAPDVEHTEWGSGFWTEREAPPLADEKMRKVSGRHEDAIIRAGTGHHGVSSLWTFIYPTPEIKIHQYMFETPIDESHTSLYLVNLRNFMLEPENDERMRSRNEYVAAQDRDVLTDVRPIQTPETRTKEFFVPSDGTITAYRDKISEWESRGWRIDSDEVERNRLKVAYAIPSPARRNSKGWILDTVPLKPSNNRAGNVKAANE